MRVGSSGHVPFSDPNAVSFEATASPDLALYARATKRVGVVTGFLMLGMLIQLSVQALLAYHFGAGPATDAYFMARYVTNQIVKFLLVAQLSAIFIPIFLEVKAAEGIERSWQMTVNTMNLFCLLAAGFSAAMIVAAPWLVRLMVPGFQTGAQTLTTGLVRWLFLGSFFSLASGLAMAVYHAHHRFTVPAALGLVAPACIAMALVFMVGRWDIYAVVYGAVVGQAVQLVLYLLALRPLGFRWQARIGWDDPALRKIFKMLIPFFFNYLFSMGVAVVYTILASGFPSGHLSALTYADRLRTAIIHIAMTATGIVIFPSLALRAAQADLEALNDLLRKSLRVITYFIIPLSVGIIVLREPITRLFFERGAFTSADTSRTALVLFIYVLSYFPHAVAYIFGKLGYAVQDVPFLLTSGITLAVVQVVGFIVLVPYLGYLGLAMAQMITAYVLMTSNYLVLRWRGWIEGELIPRPFLTKVLGISLVMGIVISGLHRLMGAWFPTPAAALLTMGQLALLAGVGTGVYALLCRWLAVEEFFIFSNLIKEWLARRAPTG